MRPYCEIMTTVVNIGTLECVCAKQSNNRIAYILYPIACIGNWIVEAARRYGITIVVVTGIDWPDDLTPWESAPVRRGAKNFAGHAAHFLHRLRSEVVPAVESQLAMSLHPYRVLAGVSLGALFALWQWTQCDTFTSIACLSGAFWYKGFVSWFYRHLPRKKKGKAYFSIGMSEGDSCEADTRHLQADTREIVGDLESRGIDARMCLEPACEHQYSPYRFNAALSSLYSLP